MAWGHLLVADLFEVGWAIGLKYTEGFTKLWPSVGTVIAMILSFYFLSQSLKTLPVGMPMRYGRVSERQAPLY